MKKIPAGLIIIKHQILRRIDNSECIAALPTAWKSLNREFVEIEPAEIDLSKLYDTHFESIAISQREQFRKSAEPLLKKFPQYKILYFGLAPIPLGIDLGFVFRNHRDIEVFQFHHRKKIWYQDLPDEIKIQNTPTIENLPSLEQKGLKSLVLRIGISHPVNKESTYEIISDAAEVDFYLSNPDEDAIVSKKMMNEVAEKFKNVVDEVSRNKSGIKTIHLFASIPSGYSFLIGSKISPNIHPLFQTYQYSATRTPKYKPALLIKGEYRNERKLSKKQIEIAKNLKKALNAELIGNIRTHLKKYHKIEKSKSWISATLTYLDESVLNDRSWLELPGIWETSLSDDSLEMKSGLALEGFYWRNKKWHLDDSFFVALKKRLKKAPEIKYAWILFLFHEALHYKKHKLGETTAFNIGSFPKVLEAADYQADIYALINLHGFVLKSGHRIKNVKEFYLKLIDIATETMWSFDDNGNELKEIQIRRLNRFLNWYWQYIRIEKDGESLEGILKILEEKPVIELNGLEVFSQDNRVYYDLNKRTGRYLEIAAFFSNEVRRAGSASNMQIENLIEGIKMMNGEMIKTVLRSFLWGK